MYQIRLVQSFSPFTTTPIYSPDLQDSLPVESGHFTLELNEGGSLEFTLPYTHPYYEALTPLSSYVQVTEDGEEIFYGRIYDRSEPTLTGRISYQAEGALSFLQDSEVSPESKDAQGNYNTRTLSAEAFFRWCIQQHNADVADPRRQFTVGNVTASRKGETDEYQITSFTETKSALSQYILDRYGGVLRVRPGSNGAHYIDWVQDYGVANPQPVEIGSNVTDMTNAISGDGVFTVLRPVGANGLTLTPNTINVFPAEKVAEYGRIVKTVTFGDADTEEKLRAKANTYISRIEKKMTKETQVSLVDFHFLDGNIPKIRVGHMFSNIRGMEGETMTVFNWDQDIISVDKGQFTLKNKKDLDSVTDGRVKGGTISKSSARGSKAGSLALKYYHEGTDEAMLEVKKLTATVETAEIKIGELDVDIQGTADIAANALTISTNNFELISRVKDRVDNIEDVSIAGMEVRIQNIEGTAVIKNSDMISTVAGEFEIWEDQATGKKTVHLKNGAELAVDNNGAYITVGGLNDTLGQHEEDIAGQRLIINEMTGSALWTTRDDITEVVGEFDVIWIPDPDNPGEFIKKLKIQSGGGVVINRNNTEFGLFDEGNLTGGVIVEKINEDDYETTIKGSRVIIGDRLTDDDLSSWAQDAANGLGVFARYLTVKRLTAQEIETMLANINLAFLNDLEVGDINATGEIHAETFTGGDLQLSGSVDVTEDIVASGDIWSEGGTYSDSGIYDASSGEPLRMKVVDVQPTGNILTITYNDGTTKTFEKAAPVTSLAGAWSGNTFVVTPTGMTTPRYTIGFTGDPNEQLGIKIKNVDVGRVSGLISIEGAVCSDYYDDSSGTIVHGTERHQFSASASISSLLQSLTVTSNSPSGQPYTPDEGYIGFGSVTVNVDASVTGAWEQSNPQSSANPYNKYTVRNAKSQVVLSETINVSQSYDSTTHKYTATVSATNSSSVITAVTGTEAYTAGQNSVNVITDGWDGGRITFKPSAGTGASKNVTLSAGAASWSNNTATVTITDTNANQTAYTVTVDASDRYTAGQNSVNVNRGTWDGGQITFSPSAGTGASKVVTLSKDSASWSSATCTIVIKDTTANQTAYTTTVTAPLEQKTIEISGNQTSSGVYTPSSGKVGFSKITINTTKEDVSVGTFSSNGSTDPGTSYTNISAITPSYANHWYTFTATCGGSTKNYRLKVSPSLTTKTISANGEYTPSSGNVGFSKVTVNVPDPHTFTTKEFTSNGTYYASTYKYSGFSKVTVNVNTATETKSITANGTYTPSSGKIGFSQVTVNITDPHTFSTFSTSSNGTFYSSTAGYSGYTKVTVTVPAIADIKEITTDGNHNDSGYYNCTVTTTGGASVSFNAGSMKGLKLSQGAFTVTDGTANGTYWAKNSGYVGFDAVVVNKGGSGATLDYIGVDPNRPSDSNILNSDKQPYLITSAKATYWFLIKAMNGSTTLDSKYLGVGTNVSSGGGGHNNAITFTRGALYAPNTYTWYAQVGTNVTDTATKFDFYY